METLHTTARMAGLTDEQRADNSVPGRAGVSPTPTRIEEETPVEQLVSWRSEISYAVASACVSLLVAVWSLRLWEWRPGLPLNLSNDSLFVAMQLRDIGDHGWYLNNPDLGFPFTQNASIFPELNVVHVLLIKGFGLFTDPISAGVLYFVAGWPLAALAMYCLARTQRIGRLPALVVAVLYASAPGHQTSFPHLWLAAYWVLPVGVWVALMILAREPLIGGAPGGRRGLRRWLTWRSAATGLGLTAVGLSGAYYGAFVLILVATATIGARLAAGTARSWLPGVAALTYTGGVMLLPMIYANAHVTGLTGAPATNRSPMESEYYAGKLMDLVLPWSGHRISFFADVTALHNTSSAPTIENAAIGVVAVVGCAMLVLVGFRAFASSSPEQPMLRRWAVLGGVSFAFYTVGGLGSVVAFFLSPQIRTWSRLFIVIMIFGLLMVGSRITRLGDRRGRAAMACASVAIAVIGVLDQTNPAQAPDYSAIQARLSSTRIYTTALQTEVRPGCGVFQVPVVPFPEVSGPGRMGSYEQLLPYLTSNHLKWSYGAMHGTRQADWQQAVDLTDARQLGELLASAGFCAVEVDTRGFSPGNDPRARFQTEFGTPLATSPDGNFVTYRLPPKPAGAAALRSRLLSPVYINVDANAIRRKDAGMPQYLGKRADIRAVNVGDRPVAVTVSFRLATIGESRTLTVTSSTGIVLKRTQVEADAPITVEVPIWARPGTSLVQLALSGQPVEGGTPVIQVSGDLSDIAAAGPTGVRVVTAAELAAATTPPLIDQP